MDTATVLRSTNASFTPINVPELNLGLGFQGQAAVLYDGMIFVFGSGDSNHGHQCVYTPPGTGLAAAAVTNKAPLARLNHQFPKRQQLRRLAIQTDRVL